MSMVFNLFDMKRFLSVIFAISACFGTASAEAVLSLDSCRNMAIRNNKSLKIAEANAKAASYNRKSAFANYFPTIDVSGGYLYSSKEVSLLNDGQKSLLPNLGSQMSTPIAGYLKQLAAVDPALAAKLAPLANGLGDAMNGIGSSLVDALRTDTRNMWGGMVSLTQPIFTGGKIIAYNRITKYAEEIAEKQKDASVKDVVFGVDEAYWQVVSLVQKQQLAEEYLQLLDTLQYNVDALIEEGVATKADGLTVAVKQNEAEITLTKVTDGVALSRMLLAQMCGMPIHTPFRLADEENLSLSGTPGKVGAIDMEDVFANREEIQSLEMAAKIYDNKRRVELSAMLPNIALVGSYSFSNPNVLNGFDKSVGGLFNVGVVLRIPIFHTADLFKVKASKAQQEIARLTMDDAKEKVELQVNQAAFKLDEAYRKLKMTAKNMEKAEENLQNANTGFAEGVLTASDVMEAQTAWLQAKSELLDAKIDARLCDIYLSKAMGRMSY